MINKVIIVGRVGKDAETFGTAEKKVAKFTVATSERYNNNNGEVVQNTEWHNIVVFKKLAEICEKYAQKGMLIYVEGKIQTQSYERDGQKQFSTQVVANVIQFLGKPQEQGNTHSQGDNINDDLPF